MAVRESQKFATQVDARLLIELRQLANDEGRKIQSLVEEALRDLVAKRRAMHPRPTVMSMVRETIVEYSPLYERFAK